MRFDKLVSSLLTHLQTSPSGDRLALLELLQQWLRMHVRSWNEKMRAEWGLNELAAVDLSSYPIEDSSLDPDEELQQLNAVPPTSLDVMAMRIRDIFWAGITVESTVDCPRCGTAQLKILEDPTSDAILLACDLCSWGQTPQGEQYRGPRHLKPATRAGIKRWRHAGIADRKHSPLKSNN